MSILISSFSSNIIMTIFIKYMNFTTLNTYHILKYCAYLKLKKIWKIVLGNYCYETNSIEYEGHKMISIFFLTAHLYKCQWQTFSWLRWISWESPKLSQAHLGSYKLKAGFQSASCLSSSLDQRASWGISFS